VAMDETDSEEVKKEIASRSAQRWKTVSKERSTRLRDGATRRFSSILIEKYLKCPH